MIERWNNKTSAQMDKRVLGDVLRSLDESQGRASAALPHTRSTIMKNPMVKLGIAAAIIAAVVLGLFEFIDTGGASGVVWAEVAQKVQASRGTVFRSTDHRPGYSMHYHSDTQYRNDLYQGDQIVRTMFGDFNTGTVILIRHRIRTYSTKTFGKLEQGRFWANPKSTIQEFLSHKHRKLGAKTIEGVLCEGIETTDPAFAGVDFPVESLMAQLWVSVETGCPIRYEDEIAGYNGEDGQLLRSAVVVDQFQWDVDLDESLFEPNIPPDYIDISPDQW